MGNTQKLGNYVNAIFQDASNNVGIGAAPSGSYKLEVTGTAKVSGILTLGSTISNGTYAYTLPSATGTLALTSALGDYLPLAGGTLTGALGGTSATFSSSVTAGSLIVNQASTAGDIILKFAIAGTPKWLVGLTNDVVDDNFTIYQDGAGGGNRFTINTSGLVGIGTSSPSDKLNVVVSANGNNTRFDGPTSGLIFQTNATSTDIISYGGTTPAYRQMNFATGASTAMSITSGGNVLIGKTSTGVDDGDGFRFDSSGVLFTSVAAGENTYYLRDITNAVYRFYVTSGGTINATNTTISAISDVRLKENITDLEIGLEAIMALRPRKFDWKKESGNDGKNVRGFIAQEFEQVFPDLIDESINPSPEGEEPYKQIRQDLIPVLVKAVQEQQAQIEELKKIVATK